MSREEDLIRSTTHAIASTVRDVPPLNLGTATVELRSPAREPRRPGGDNGRRHRHWSSWTAPVTAAALVVALAVALVFIRDTPDGSANLGSNTPVPTQVAPTAYSTAINPSASGPGGAPRYYVALKVIAEKTQAPTKVGALQYGIVAGDSLTGETLATFAPPANTTFQSVSAAADDLTFAVFAVTSSNGSFDPIKGVTFTGSWYEVRLDPGTANPARLRKLPIKPWSWAASSVSTPSPGEIYATTLSQSGRELAVADIPEVPAADKAGNWQEVKVFSVATGRLLHDWTENDPTASLETVVATWFADVPVGTSPLTWIDGDRAVALATSHETLPSGTVSGIVRRLDVAGPATGNLITDSTVIWSGTLAWNQSRGCFQVNQWPPLVSADGKTISCTNWVMTNASPGHVDFGTYPLAAGIQPTLDYRATILPEKQTGGLDAGVLWVSPSADTLIVDWGGPGLKPSTGAHFGVISHGKFTPLPLQANRAALLAMDITF